MRGSLLSVDVLAVICCHVSQQLFQPGLPLMGPVEY